MWITAYSSELEEGEFWREGIELFFLEDKPVDYNDWIEYMKQRGYDIIMVEWEEKDKEKYLYIDVYESVEIQSDHPEKRKLYRE